MRGKILLVDDNKELRTDFKLWYEEYDITEASCAADALPYLKSPTTGPGRYGRRCRAWTAWRRWKNKALAPEKPVII